MHLLTTCKLCGKKGISLAHKSVPDCECGAKHDKAHVVAEPYTGCVGCWRDDRQPALTLVAEIPGADAAERYLLEASYCETCIDAGLASSCHPFDAFVTAALERAKARREG